MSPVPTNMDGARRPALNALKHGLRSAAILLPGDDAAEFGELRRGLFAMYRPLTPAEERCVERIAACEWRMARWQRWETGLNAKLDALLNEGPDGPAAQHHNPDTHHWQHRSVDCTLQEGRLERSMLRTEKRLLELQSLRRNRLIAGVRTDGTPARSPAPSEAPTGGQVTGVAPAAGRASPSGASLPALGAIGAAGVAANRDVASRVARVHPAAQAASTADDMAAGVSGPEAGRRLAAADPCLQDEIGNSGKRKETSAPAAGQRAQTGPAATDDGVPLPHGVAFPQHWTPAFEPVCVSSVTPGSMPGPQH